MTLLSVATQSLQPAGTTTCLFGDCLNRRSLLLEADRQHSQNDSFPVLKNETLRLGIQLTARQSVGCVQRSPEAQQGASLHGY
ncbi:hypothetical protein EYF80_012278 [Liparis tanakae]|uniref:Uncharacterized protein n=1 Tax=Liparis tanakae TaxID=230148 RepID=A0A4Z2IJ48_9TELE|nr:hypothetical protein EYF80_012278 [Liparis tanakae]